MSITWAELRPLVDPAAAPEPAIAALRGLSERERKALTGPIAEAIGATNYRFHAHDPEHRQALVAAAFCVAGSAGWLLRTTGPCSYHHGNIELLVEILAERRPAWLPKLVAGLCESSSFLPWWRLSRAIVLRGLADPPPSPGYVLGSIREAADVYLPPHNTREVFAADPRFAADFVWNWFTTEGAGSSLANDDKNKAGNTARFAGTWADALAEEAAAGRIDRGRVIDETLRRLALGFPDADQKWFAEFHDRLSPTAAETAARLDAYLRLLSSQYGRAVAIGLAGAHRAGIPDVPAFARAAAPVLVRKEKKGPLDALRLLAPLAGGHRDEVVPCVAHAFGHRDTAVQEAAWRIIEPQLALLPAAVAAEVRGQASAASPSIAARIGGAPPIAPMAPAPFVPEAFPAPIGSPEELAREFAALLDGNIGPVGLERVLEAAARYGSTPQHGLAPHLGPVAARHSWRRMLDSEDCRRTPGGVPEDLEFWLAELVGVLADPSEPVLHWFPGSVTESISLAASSAYGVSPTALLIVRVHELTVRVYTRQCTPLLATPTWRDGTIEDSVHAQRLTAVAEPGPADLAQAALRVRREPVLRAATYVADIHRGGGLYGTVQTDPWVLPELTVGVPPDEVLTALAGPFTRGRVAVRGNVRFTHSTLRYDRAANEHLWPWVAPGEPDLALAHWLPAFSLALSGEYSGALEIDAPLYWLSTAARFSGQLIPVCLAMGLSSPRAATRLLAAEITAAAIGDGRLDPAALGGALTDLSASRVLKLGRVADSLAKAAQSDPRSAWQLLGALLPGVLADRPRDTAGLLRVACDVAVQAGAADVPSGLAEAARRADSTRVTAEARRLAALLAR